MFGFFINLKYGKYFLHLMNNNNINTSQHYAIPGTAAVTVTRQTIIMKLGKINSKKTGVLRVTTATGRQSMIT